MKTLTGLFLLLLASQAAVASSSLVTNPHLPYPPACARMPDPLATGGLESQAVSFYDREIRFYDSQGGDDIPMRLRIFRAPCSEPNRSLIWLEFALGSTYSSRDLNIRLPSAVAEVAPNWRKLMNLASEPNGSGSWGWVDREATYLSSQLNGMTWYYGSPRGERRWVFLLDNGPQSPYEFGESGLTPSEYNSAFKLVLRYNPYDFLIIDVPATETLLPGPAPRMPLSGRLTGNWEIDGASNQGLMLSIAEKVLPYVPLDPNPPSTTLVMFVAFYTFDADRNPLWLTGAAEFSPGARKITIPIELVSNGEFRGDKPANRESAGQLTLRSYSCNDLRMDFDFAQLELGSGTRRLHRLNSLETAGYDCRDYEAKVAANK
jgi:hypothetical protein